MGVFNSVVARTSLGPNIGQFCIGVYLGNVPYIYTRDGDFLCSVEAGRTTSSRGPGGGSIVRRVIIGVGAEGSNLARVTLLLRN